MAMGPDLLLSYYGDDLTGSTDAMEALSLHGLSPVLFVHRPTAEQLSRFASSRVIGLAGISRSQSPEWMDVNLSVDLGWLRSLAAPLCHYKVCSTFDSAPEIGSIGRAIDIGQRLFEQPVTPLVVGTPQLRRYTVFGNHFASVGSETFRLDRHPVMSRHPVTPMDEADLRLHLARQTTKRIGLASLADLKAADADARIEHLKASCDILLFDVLDDQTQATAGRYLWAMRRAQGTFIVGSSGIDYALVREWAERDLLPEKAKFPPLAQISQLAAISGSCSPVTANQIRRALSQGFEHIALDPLALSRPDSAKSASQSAMSEALAALGRGKSIILSTALGPETILGEAQGLDASRRNALGRELGLILRQLLEKARLPRVVIAGGDSSSHALGELGLYALTTRMPLPETPGAPLCTAHADSGQFDGLEIALKGGQLGGENYFINMRDGRF